MFSPRSQAPARPFTSVPSPDEDKRNLEDQVSFPAKQEKTESEGCHSSHGGWAHGLPSSVRGAKDPR